MHPPFPRRRSRGSDDATNHGLADHSHTVQPSSPRRASDDSGLTKHSPGGISDDSHPNPWAPVGDDRRPEVPRKRSADVFPRPGMQRRRTSHWSNRSSQSTLHTPLRKTRGKGFERRSSSKKSKEEREFHHPLEKEPTSPAAIVSFDGPKDNYLPVNWSRNKKLSAAIICVLSTGICTFASGVWSAAVVAQIVPRFHSSHIVATLGVSLFVGGQGIGSMIWAPISEVYGRKATVLPPVLLGAVFALGAGQSENLRSLLVLRFFQGLFSSAPITVTVGVLSDLFPPQDRVIVIALYCATLLGGPTVGPVISAAICDKERIDGWRWTLYTAAILGLVSFLLTLFFTKESNAPTLLIKKAKKLRSQSGNWALHAKHEEGITSYKAMAIKYLLRPVQLLFTPIGFFMSLYAGFTFGILFGSLSTFPVVFEAYRHWGPITASTPFVALLVGILLALVFYIVRYQILRKTMKKDGPVKGRPSPESKLPPMMVGSVLFTGGLFVMAWTAHPKYPWIAPISGAVLQGFGFFTITISSNLYLIDTFLANAASAIAGVTLMRNLFAVAFPLFGGVMVTHLGVEWGISVFGFVAAGMLPIPFIFYFFGRTIRGQSKWSQEPPAPPMAMKLSRGPPTPEFLKMGQLASMGLLQYIGFGPMGRPLGPPGGGHPGIGPGPIPGPFPPGVMPQGIEQLGTAGMGPPGSIPAGTIPPGISLPEGMPPGMMPPGMGPGAASGAGIQRSLSLMQRMGLKKPPPPVYQPGALRSQVHIDQSRLSWNDSSSTLWGPEEI